MTTNASSRQLTNTPPLRSDGNVLLFTNASLAKSIILIFAKMFQTVTLHMNEWMNEYSSPHTSYRWRGERDIEPIKCTLSPHTSYRWRERVIEQSSVCAHHTPATGGEERESWANQVYALTTHQLQVERRESHRANQVYALTTHQLQVERKRVIEPIKCALTTHQLQVERERESS